MLWGLSAQEECELYTLAQTRYKAQFEQTYNNRMFFDSEVNSLHIPLPRFRTDCFAVLLENEDKWGAVALSLNDSFLADELSKSFKWLLTMYDDDHRVDLYTFWDDEQRDSCQSKACIWKQRAKSFKDNRPLKKRRVQ